MFNSANHQENANKNHNEILPYTCQNGYHQKVYKTQMLKGCGEKGTLYTVVGM